MNEYGQVVEGDVGEIRVVVTYLVHIGYKRFGFVA